MFAPLVVYETPQVACAQVSEAVQMETDPPRTDLCAQDISEDNQTCTKGTTPDTQITDLTLAQLQDCGSNVAVQVVETRTRTQNTRRLRQPSRAPIQARIKRTLAAITGNSQLAECPLPRKRVRFAEEVAGAAVHGVAAPLTVTPSPATACDSREGSAHTHETALSNPAAVPPAPTVHGSAAPTTVESDSAVPHVCDYVGACREWCVNQPLTVGAMPAGMPITQFEIRLGGVRTLGSKDTRAMKSCIDGMVV